MKELDLCGLRLVRTPKPKLAVQFAPANSFSCPQRTLRTLEQPLVQTLSPKRRGKSRGSGFCRSKLCEQDRPPWSQSSQSTWIKLLQTCFQQSFKCRIVSWARRPRGSCSWVLLRALSTAWCCLWSICKLSCHRRQAFFCLFLHLKS